MAWHGFGERPRNRLLEGFDGTTGNTRPAARSHGSAGYRPLPMYGVVSTTFERKDPRMLNVLFAKLWRGELGLAKTFPEEHRTMRRILASCAVAVAANGAHSAVVQPCGEEVRRLATVLPSGLRVGWKMDMDRDQHGSCRRIQGVVSAMPEGMAATARVLNEIARSLWMFGGDISSGDMVSLCVSAIAGRQGSKQSVRPGHETDATCTYRKRDEGIELTITLAVRTGRAIYR